MAAIVAAADRLAHRRAGVGGAVRRQPERALPARTPMTEPLLFATTLMCAWLLTDWATSHTLEVHADASGGGWSPPASPATRRGRSSAALVVLALARALAARSPASPRCGPAFWRLARYPLGAAVFFLVLSRATVGEWFVSGGFYVPDPTLQGQPAVVWEKIQEGTRELGGLWLVRLATAAVAVLGPDGACAGGRARRSLCRSVCSRPLALPFSAFLSGHPFRIRYEVPLIVAVGGSRSGWRSGLARRAAPVVGAAGLLLVMREAPHRSIATAPMLVEAQLDRADRVRPASSDGLPGARLSRRDDLRQHGLARRTTCRSSPASGSAFGDFLHEGNHPMWDVAIASGGAPVRGLDAGRGSRRGRRRARAANPRESAIRGWLRARLRRRECGLV